MGLDGPSARELARRAATGAGGRAPAPVAAPASTPDPLLAPARAADVRPGQVDAAGRRTAFPAFTPIGSAPLTPEERIRRAVLGG